MSLTRSFMQAGTGRVLVSLWDVNDQTGATFMKRFYSFLLSDGLRPVAALRAVQLEMKNQPGREAPFYWAGFVFRGDWKGAQLR